VQTSVLAQSPQCCVCPQPMSKSPQERPWAEQVVGWQQTLLWHTPEHEPQSCVMPQPMSSVPQFLLCAAQLVGVHTPHTFAVPPPPHV
jgi:hypothetical protein